MRAKLRSPSCRKTPRKARKKRRTKRRKRRRKKRRRRRRRRKRRRRRRRKKRIRRSRSSSRMMGSSQMQRCKGTMIYTIRWAKSTTKLRTTKTKCSG